MLVKKSALVTPSRFYSHVRSKHRVVIGPRPLGVLLLVCYARGFCDVSVCLSWGIRQSTFKKWKLS